MNSYFIKAFKHDTHILYFYVIVTKYKGINIVRKSPLITHKLLKVQTFSLDNILGINVAIHFHPRWYITIFFNMKNLIKYYNLKSSLKDL